MGDPLGIGAEVIVKSLADRPRRGRARWVVLGYASCLDAAARAAGIEPFWWIVPSGSPVLLEASGAHDVVVVDYARDASLTAVGPPDPSARGGGARATREGGEASFRFVEDAILAAKGRLPGLGPADAIVTGPINKEAWALAGRAEFPGHTELLAARFRGKRQRMMFVAPQLRTMLVTTHVPLSHVAGLLSLGRVLETIELAHEACVRLGVERPRVAVAGLNPHASEHGLFGDEEARVIEPAIALARQQGIDASGPHPGDTVFNAAVRGRFDIVVAMYHDQGLIPVKLLAFDRAVNYTAGLPAVRTSPDHGTAYDIAGRNAADPGSMAAAMDLALVFAAGR
ncbi:MAG: 4-hydroxythreonine-4-phosphate dehydrogenase PdxA [Phycisphaerales bacterium]|nr:4-hydroxythreonine-4-phosphate dehydrogenase PdxA [Phycisphaerales bacterium]